MCDSMHIPCIQIYTIYSILIEYHITGGNIIIALLGVYYAEKLCCPRIIRMVNTCKHGECDDMRDTVRYSRILKYRRQESR